MSDEINNNDLPELPNVSRREFWKGTLSENEVGADPVSFFVKWYKQAHDEQITEAEACTLATATPDGKPSTRTIYIRDIFEGKFIFYTNYESRKGREMAINPNVSLTFFWKELERQVHVHGTVEMLDSAISDFYFESRPRDSRIGAWTSRQSNVIESRKVLEAEFEKRVVEFDGKHVSRPPFWGGYIMTPLYIEFWQGGAARLHDRIVCTRNDTNWKIERLSP
jgi:pyridoxamine 5'-phosphate oxidase